MNSSKSVTAVFVPASIPGVTRVDFTSDHDLLTDETETFAGEGTPYTAPTWDPSLGHSNPISQARDTPLAANVTLTLPPCVGPFTLEGAFSGTITLTGTGQGSGSMETVAVQSNTNLPKGFEYYNQSITWTLTNEQSTSFDMGTSGPHRIYVLWGTPHTPTVARLNYLLPKVDGMGPSQAGQIGEAIAHALSEDTGFGGPGAFVPLWLALDDPYQYLIDCDAGQSLARMCLRVLGWDESDTEPIVAYPSTDNCSCDYTSDCSQSETREGKTLHFRYDDETTSTDGWYPAENGFRLRAQYGGTWYYLTVHGFSGPFSSNLSDETSRHKHCLYKIMDNQRDNTDYGQYWGRLPGGFTVADPLP